MELKTTERYQISDPVCLKLMFKSSENMMW